MSKLERRSSKRLERREGSAPYLPKQDSRTDAGGSTGLTKYMGDASLDWDESGSAAAAAPKRSMTFRRKAAEPKEKLPRNWKKAKDKDGTVYYLNTVTQRRCHEPPPELPAGWREALHQDSGRGYYYHKATRQSTFEFPSAVSSKDDDDDDEEVEPPPAPEGFFSRTVSKFVKGKNKAEEMTRSNTMSQKSFKPGASSVRTRSKTESDKPADSAGGGQKTVFISCSTLIKEVKLCVGAEHQAALDTLYEKLTSHQLPAEQAVKHLMELVGSTVVQQAGLSVMNSQKGTLPHGWLEYQDEASGRPYYYNVHTKVTTWYKPSAPTTSAPPPPAQKRGSFDEINMACTLETHNVAMTGFI